MSTDIVEIDTNALPDYSNCIPKNIPIEKLVDLRKKGLTYSQIAAVVGCSKPNVVIRLQGILPELETIEDFKSSKADIIANNQRRVLNQLTTAKLEKSSAYQLVGMFSLLHETEQKERGKDIQALVGLAEVLGSLHKLRKVVEDSDKQGSNEPDYIDVTPLNE